MTDNSLVSVCIAVYNRENFILHALRSVLNQTYQNFEIIIIDDGSTDHTVNKISSIKDSRIKLSKNTTNKGVVYTRNRYLEETKGEYIAILDSDDEWLPEKLEKQIEFFKSNPRYGICGTYTKRQYDNGNSNIWKYPLTDEELRVRLFWGSGMVHSSVMIKSHIIKDNNIKYNSLLKQAEDYDLIRQLMRKTKGANIGEVLTIYNIHGQQFTEKAKEEQVSEAFKVALRYTNDNGLALNDTQINAYKKVSDYTYSLHIIELKELNIFFTKLLSLCKKTNPQTYDKLITNLTKQWFVSCFFSSKNGLMTIKEYNRGLKNNYHKIDFPQLVKFYLRCLFRLK